MVAHVCDLSIKGGGWGWRTETGGLWELNIHPAWLDLGVPASVRDPVSKIKVEDKWRQKLKLVSDFYTHSCTHIHTRTHIAHTYTCYTATRPNISTTHITGTGKKEILLSLFQF